MPLAIRCDCGRQLRVAEQHAGKRVKCPGCGGTVTVPDQEATARMAGPPKIRFTCVCGKAMLAKAEYAGRATRCPECGKTLTIPGGDGDGREQAAAIRKGKPAPRREAPPAEDDWEDEEDERPVRRKGKGKARKGSHLPLLLALGAVLFLLIGGGVGAAVWWLWKEEPPKPLSSGGPVAAVEQDPRDVDLVAAEAQALVGILPAALWQNQTVKDGYAQAVQASRQDPLMMMQTRIGLRVEDISRFLVVVLDLNQGQSYAVVTTTVDYDRQRILNQAPGVAPRQHLGRTYYAGGGPPGASQAFFFPGKKVMVLGQEAAVQSCIRALSEKKAGAALVADLEGQLTGHQIAGVFRGGLPPQAKQQMARDLQGPLKGAAPLLEFTKVAGAMGVDTSLRIRLSGTFPDEPRAQQAKTSIDGLKGLAAVSLFAAQGELQKAGMPEAEAKEVVTQASNFLNGVQVTQQGTEVTVTAAVDLQTLDRVFQSLSRLGGQPGGRMPVPPPGRFPGGRPPGRPPGR